MADHVFHMKDKRTKTKPEARTMGEAGNDGFGTLNLDSHLLATLAELGYEEPTPI